MAKQIFRNQFETIKLILNFAEHWINVQIDFSIVYNDQCLPADRMELSVVPAMA